MKFHQVALLILLSVLTFSCADTLTDYGSGIQPTSDQIEIGADTFHLRTSTDSVKFIYSKPIAASGKDSFLLGRFYNEKYGSTYSDILAQVNCPKNFTFPANAVPDSVYAVLYCQSWIGNQYDPLDINIYEMNKGTFNYSELYKSNIDPLDYCDKSILLGHGIFSGKDALGDRTNSTALVIKLDSKLLKQFRENQNYFNEDSTFTKLFKGIYVTTKFGSSAILNINQLDIEYYYHYTYTEAGTNKLNTVSNMILFPANKEVRQVNRFQHPDRNKFVTYRDSVDYVASPANFQTNILLPLKRIQDSISADPVMKDKRQIINKAILRADITELKDTVQGIPLVNYMLLIKASEADNFFATNKLPSDTSTVAVLGQISYEQVGTTDVYKYYYSYDVSRIIATELKTKNYVNDGGSLKMVLIPVSVGTATNSSGSSSISSVKHQYKLSAVTLRSGQVIDPKTINAGEKATEPMHLKLVYSGY